MENQEQSYKTITFKGDVDNFKNKGGVVTLQASADTDDVDKNLLADIMDMGGGVTITIKANQTELVKDEDEEADGQTKLPVGDDE